MTEPAVRFRDFTPDNAPTPITFRVAPDEYTAFGGISVPILQELGTALKGIGDDTPEGGDVFAGIATKIETLLKVFDTMMAPDEAARWRARVYDKKSPVDFRVVLSITQWLMEQYTNRPTGPSSTSSDGSPTDDGGQPSTAGASPEASTA